MMGWESVPLNSEVGSMKAESGEEAKKTPKKDPSKKRRSPAPQKTPTVRKLRQLFSDASLMLTPFESLPVADVKVHLDLLKRERLLSILNPLLLKLMSHPKNGGTFNAPLDWRSTALNLPDYLKVIETPMDFATIKARVLQGFYPSKRDFVNDLRLVFQNAKKYNPSTHPVHKNAIEMLAELERDLQKLKTATEASKNQKVEHNCEHCRGRSCVACNEKCRAADPPILQCFGRSCGQKIKQGTVYYVTTDGLRAWCFKCYATLGMILPTDDSVPDEREKEEEEKKIEEKRKREERKLSNDHYPGPSIRGKPRDKSNESAPTSPRSPDPPDNEDNSDESSVASRDQQAAAQTAPAPAQYKVDLMKRTLFEDTERWVQCDSCGRWLHEVCGLFQNATQHSNPNVKREPAEGYIYPALREVYLEFLKTLTSGDQLKYRCPVCRSHDTKNVDGNSLKLLPRRIKMTPDYPDPSRMGLFFRAASLPETPTAMFIEFCLRRRLQELVAEQLNSGVGVDLETQSDVGEVYVRMVACSEHSWSPDSQLKDVFCDVPDQLSYTSKTFMVFQTRNGIDLCLLCLYVQEYGPNQGSSSKRVYISYLDSVDYFRPRHARRGIYYEMLVAYFAWLRLRGFTAVHIWACPPKRGCGYVFWQRPPHQKTPYRGRLVQWYKDMCQRALEVGCCAGVGSFFTDSFQSYLGEKQHKAVVPTREETKLESMPPAFEGDYWLTKASNLCRLRSWRLIQLAARPRPTVKDAMETILKKLKKHGSARVFNKPVDAEALNIPHYRQIIKKPMDFSTCRDKLAEGQYATPKDMADDIRLVFENATKFNPPGHWIHRAALTLRDYFEKEAREVLLAQSHVKVRLRSGEHLDPFTADLQWDDTAADPEWESLALDDLDLIASPSLRRKLSEETGKNTSTPAKRENGQSPRVSALTCLSPRVLSTDSSSGSSSSTNSSSNGKLSLPKAPRTPTPPALKPEPPTPSVSSLATISVPNTHDLPSSSLSVSTSSSPSPSRVSSFSSQTMASTTTTSLSNDAGSAPVLLAACSSSSISSTSTSTSTVPSSSAPSIIASKSSRSTPLSQPSQPQSVLPTPVSVPPTPVKSTSESTWSGPPVVSRSQPRASNFANSEPLAILETSIPLLPPPPPPPPPLALPTIPENGPTAPHSPTLTAQTSSTKRRRLGLSPHGRNRMGPPLPTSIWPIIDPGLSPLYPQSLTPETAEQLHQYHQFQQYYRPQPHHLQQQHYQQLQDFQELQQHQHHQQQMQQLQQQQHDAAALHAFQQSQNPNFDSWPPWGPLSSFPTHPSTASANALAMALSTFPESSFPNFPSLSPSSASFLLQALSPPISPLALNSSSAASEMFANLIKSLPPPGSGTAAAPAAPLQTQDSSFLPIPSLDRPLDYGFPSYPNSTSQWRPDTTSSLSEVTTLTSAAASDVPSLATSPPMLEAPTTPLPPPALASPVPPTKRTPKVGRAKKLIMKPPVTQAPVVIKREVVKREPKSTPAKATPAKQPKIQTPKTQPKPPAPSPQRPSRKNPAPPLPPPPTSTHNWRKANIPQVPRLLAADMKRSIEEFFVLYLQDETFAKATSKQEPLPEPEPPALNSSHKSQGKRKAPGPKPTPKKDPKEIKAPGPESSKNGEMEIGSTNLCSDLEKANDFTSYVQPYLKAAKMEVGSIPEDPFMHQPMFESRHAFMQTCQLRRWHFDTLRHAKHASSSILFHLNTSDACDPTQLVCRKCNSNIEGTVRWHMQATCGPPLTADEKDCKPNRSPVKTRARTCNIPETEEGELCSACYATLEPEEAELFTPFRMY